MGQFDFKRFLKLFNVKCRSAEVERDREDKL